MKPPPFSYGIDYPRPTLCMSSTERFSTFQPFFFCLTLSLDSLLSIREDCGGKKAFGPTSKYQTPPIHQGWVLGYCRAGGGGGGG